MHLATPSKFPGKFTWRCIKNIASTIVTSTDDGGELTIFDSRWCNNAALGERNKLPSTWHNESGRGVNEYASTSLISIRFSMVSSRRLPKRSRTKHAAKIFPAFDVILFFPASVVKAESFCLLILSSDLSGLSLHSSMNLFPSLSPIISIFKRKFLLLT